MSFSALLARASARPHDADAGEALAERALEEEREEEAVEPVRQAAELARSNARLWHWLALLYRAMDQRHLALPTLETASRLAPADASVLHSHARVRLEAGLPAATAFEQACRAGPGRSELLLGLIAALHGEGRMQEAEQGLRALVANNPLWVEGHRDLAQLLWINGQQDSHTQPLLQALQQHPQALPLWLALADVQLQAGRYPAVLQTVVAAQHALDDETALLLHKAEALSETGMEAAADAAFGQLEGVADIGLAVRHVRHLIRAGRLEQAAARIEPWLSPDDGSMWPYAALVWRMMGDARLDWLEQGGQFLQAQDLSAHLPPLPKLAERLRALHTAMSEMPDQSVRLGTQTDGALFARMEPEIVQVRAAIVQAVQSYRDALPPQDIAHPLLCAPRDRPIRFAGSWSVRLGGDGHHANHVHPQGWISSALYISLPDALERQDGWFSAGQPQAELKLGLAPQQLVEPQPGRLVLFPSTMWHGTLPFKAGERLTIAFDVRRPRVRDAGLATGV